MQRILITGASGFLGSQLVKHFCDLGFYVVAGKRSTSDLWRLSGYLEKIRLVDLDDPSGIESVLQGTGIEFIVHTACAYGRGDRLELDVFKANVELPLDLIGFVRKNQDLVFINTDSFFAKPEFNVGYMGAYVLSKRHFWEWVQLFRNDIKVINMRLEHMYGPFDDRSKFVSWLCEESLHTKDEPNEVSLSSCFQVRDFVYIDDVVSAFQSVIIECENIQSGQEFEVGTGTEATVRTMVEQIQKSTLDLGKAGILPVFDHARDRAGEVERSVADTSALEALGWRSIVSLSEGVEKMVRAEWHAKK